MLSARRLAVVVVGFGFSLALLSGCGCEKEDEEETPAGDWIKVTSPDGGETWGEGESRNITWTSSGAVGNVDIAYSTDGGTTWTDIATGEVNDGSYAWTLPSGVDSSNCFLRVQEPDADPADVSDAVFTIASISVTVTSPNGGENWIEGENHDVTWQSVGAVGNVDVALSTDGGTTWTDISTGETNDGSYTWTVPGGVDSTNCLVRVQEADGDPSDVSDAVFTIAPVSIAVTSPNGTETWVEAEVHDVTWTSVGAVGNVDVAYSDDGGTTWTDISTGEANDGSYTWTIPAGINSNQCRVRIQEADGDPTDMSDANFTIVPVATPAITVSSPNGGEVWGEGESQDVTWTWAGTVGNVDIAYSDDSGTTWTDISTGEANDGSYTWTIPASIDSANCLIRVQEPDGDPTDTSDAVFTIAQMSITVTAPNGGETWFEDENQDITWTSVGAVGNVDIAYSDDGGTTWTDAVTGEANDGSYTWTIPGGVDSANCLVRVQEADGSPTDVSDAAFTITPKSITIISPNGTEVWVEGETHDITWTSIGPVGNLEIAYSADAGTTWISIAVGEADDGSCSWTLPTHIDSVQCIVRVREADGDPFDISDAVFTIWNGIWKVDADAVAGGDGRTWGTAFQHPEDAMAVAVAGDEVWVADGAYGVIAGVHVLQLVTGTEVYGGFEGQSASTPELDRSDRDPAANVTTLDGNLGAPADHVVIGASNCVLDGFTIQDGNADGAAPDDDGGGMHNDSVANLTVSNCIFTSNSADAEGGGMYNIDSDVTVSDCVFDGNSCAAGFGGGGGITFVGTSTYDITRTVFKNNTAVATGGGVFADTWPGDTSNVSNCVFYGNSADEGAGMIARWGDHSIVNCSFTGNTATTSCGALSVWNGTVTVENSVFWGDSAGTDDEISGGFMPSSLTVRYSNVPLAASFTDGGGNIEADACYADAAAGDLHLTNASRCIDSADNSSAPAQDIEGNSRYDDPGMPDTGAGTPDYTDMGAYEFQGDTVLRVTSPNDGTEKWAIGTTPAITWYSTVAVANVHIELSRDGGTTWGDIVATTPAAPGSYSGWTAAAPLSLDCLVRISDADSGDVPTDRSDNSFRIISGGRWYVDLAAGGLDNGTDWTNAFNEVQDAMAAAQLGDEIWVAAGTYNRQGADTVLLTMVTGVEVYGGFNSGDAWGDRDPAAKTTILDGQTLVNHVVVGADGVTIDGFTVTNGDAAGADPDDNGGGMYIDSVSNVTVVNCLFTSNTASAEGGGLYANDSSITVSDCVFDGNSSTSVVFNEGGGGAAFAGATEFTVSRTVFTNNVASGGGGGSLSLSSSGGTHSFTNCVFYGNNAAMDGAGLFASNSGASVTNCTFAGNTAGGAGGGLSTGFMPTAITATNSIFWGNSAAWENEIANMGPPGFLTMRNSDFLTQSPFADGGGNVQVDPCYADLGTGDLHLTNASQCIDSGDGTWAPSQDIEGNGRRDDPGMLNVGVGTPVYTDMGAYEFQGDTVLRVTLPNDGTEEWEMGDTPTITWYCTAAVSNVHIELSRDSGATWEDIVATTSAAPGSYSGWTAGGAVSTECLVRISDADSGDVPTDRSDLIFRLVSSDIWYVDASAAGNDDGTSWTDAYNLIQDAMVSARLGDEIRVAASTYIRQGADTVILTMKESVDVYGGHPPGGGVRNPSVNVTRLDGQNVVYHVVVGANDAIIDGFTIENGNANGAGNDTRAGGMYNASASPTVINCIFDNNSASGGIAQGGAVYNLGAARFIRCTFSNNSSPNGGAIRNGFSGVGPPSFRNCRFINNTGTGGSSFGGAVTNNAVRVRFTNCVFYNNSATWGGAVYSFSSAGTTFVNCTLVGNSSGANDGGGYYGNSICPATITNSIFWGNTGSASYPDIFDDSNGSKSRYSDIEQAPGSNGYVDDGSGGTIHSDPAFVGPPDLHLDTGSPCVDAADGDAATANDIQGNGRYDNTAVGDTGAGTPTYVDMGAFERQTSP